jgi:hypothetical protein
VKDIDTKLREEGFSVATSTTPTIVNDLKHSIRCLQAARYARELEI